MVTGADEVSGDHRSEKNGGCGSASATLDFFNTRAPAGPIMVGASGGIENDDEKGAVLYLFARIYPFTEKVEQRTNALNALYAEPGGGYMRIRREDNL